MRGNKFVISNFVCKECGGIFPLPRPKSKKREKGHIKDLWCPFCVQYVKTQEIRDKDYFKTTDGRVIY